MSTPIDNGLQTPELAKEELRQLCLRAWDIAIEQGWDVTIDARPRKRDGYQITVFTDVVRKKSTGQLNLGMDGDQ